MAANQYTLATKRKKLNTDSNMIPMINVVFLLLIFFMIAGTIRQIHSQDLEVPTSRSSKVLNVSVIDVTISQDQELRLNGDPITRENLGSAISALLQANTTSTVSLRADKRLQAQHLSTVLNIIREQNIELISLYSQTEGKG